MFHADGQTDMTNSMTARCNSFPKAPKRGQSIVRLTQIFAFLFKVSGVLTRLESGEVRPVLRELE